MRSMSSNQNTKYKFAKQYEKDDAGNKTGRARIYHSCPGCRDFHMYSVNEDPNVGKRPAWSFNGDYSCATFQPSYKASYRRYKDNQDITLCHVFVTNGKIDFCDDNPHDHNGKKGVEIPFLPDWIVEETIERGGELH